MKIVTVSPKGQITIPKIAREKCKYGKYALITDGNMIILKPIEIKIMKASKLKELDNFAALANSSFDFWNNPKDDIYSEFYK